MSRILGNASCQKYAETETVSDAELIARLRDGHNDAYTQLWQRHVAIVMHLARSYAPGSAEDLVSEAFLAVYRQIAVEHKGPETAFRPYLLTTMRNLAIKWSRDGQLVDTSPDIDTVDPGDPLSQLTAEAEAGELLAAFSELPERWQRVLWLTEVERVPRTSIAAEFEISPNAVSALTRRVRAGLRVHWFATQVPKDLRDNPAHAANLIPAFVADKASLSGAERRLVEQHITVCQLCARVNTDLRALSARSRHTTLGVVGFAALAGIIPASGTGAAGGAAALLAGGVATGVTAVGGVAAAGQSGEGPAGGSDGGPGARGEGELGRGVIDPSLTTSEFRLGGAPTPYIPPPERPVALPPGVLPEPLPESPAGSGDPDNADSIGQPGTPSPLSPGMVPVADSQRFIAPQISGVTDPDATIAITYRYVGPRVPDAAARNYAVTPEASGDWSFDFRSMGEERAGTVEYQVWAFTDEATSHMVSGEYVVSIPTLTGIEPYTLLDIGEASATGVVIQASGAPGSSVCLVSSFSSQYLEIPLDDTGTAVRRMRLLSGGFYWLRLLQCDSVSPEAMYRGPATEFAIEVDDPDMPIFGPWGPEDQGVGSIVLEPVTL